MFCKFKIIAVFIIILSVLITFASCKKDNSPVDSSTPLPEGTEKSVNSSEPQKAYTCLTEYEYEKFLNIITECNKTLEADPDNIKILFQKGEALTFALNYKEAMDCYDKILEIEPENTTALFNKGWVLRYLGEYKKALEYFEKASSIEPENLKTAYYKKDTVALLNPSPTPSTRSVTDPFYDYRVSEVIHQKSIWEREYGSEKAIEMTVKWLNGEIKEPPRPEEVSGGSSGGGSIWISFEDDFGVSLECSYNVEPCGDTPLHKAVLNEDVEEVKSLISQGVDPNIRNNYGQVPLHYVKNKEIAEILVEKGAEINVKDRDEKAPLHNIEDGDTVAFLLEKGGDVNISDGYGNTPLHYPWSKGKVEALIKGGADVDCKNEGGATPLMIASPRGKKDIIECFILNGADVNAKDNNNRTPLMVALEINNNTDMVNLLRENGAYVNIKDNEGVSPSDVLREQKFQENLKDLYKAISEDNVDKVKKLLEEEPELVNFRDENRGRTPLFQAVEAGNLEIVKLFIYKGADANIIDKHNIRPISYAVCGKNKEIIALLIDNGAEVNIWTGGSLLGSTILRKAIAIEDKEILDLLISKGADVNYKDHRDNTALQYAAYDGQLEMVEYLLEHGASIEDKDIEGDRAIHCAAYMSHKDVLELLIESGAGINYKNNEGKTPLDLATSEEIIEILLKNGAKKGDEL